jgi:hypothetical protein
MTNKLIANLWRGDDLPGYSRNKYNEEDVINLWKGAKECITNVELHVLCDEYYYERLPKWLNLHKFKGYGIGGWTNRLESFNLLPGRAVMVDLDIVFVRNCDWLWKWNESPVGMPVDPYNKSLPSCGIVTFNSDGGKLVWEEYMRARLKKPFPYEYGGVPSEMVLLQAMFAKHDWQFLEKGMVKLKSFKGCNLEAIPPDTDIVYLHGKPKFRDLEVNHPIRILWER